MRSLLFVGAPARAEVASEIIHDALAHIRIDGDPPAMTDCTICSHLFDDASHLPLLLPCGHSFCLACLQQQEQQDNITDFTGMIACALCQREAIVPAEGASGFPRNYALLDVISAAGPAAAPSARASDCSSPVMSATLTMLNSSDERGRLLCGLCTSESEDVACSDDVGMATHRCLDCHAGLGLLLCAEHNLLHGRKKANKDHRVQGLARVMCDAHPDVKLELYCTTHSQVVCLKCCFTAAHRECEPKELQVRACHESQISSFS